jgi:hypothetical protein
MGCQGGLPPLEWTGRRRRGAYLALLGHAFLWGITISVAAGAAAGTMMFPLLGTAFGAVYGGVIGVVPTVIGVVAAVIIAVRHRPVTDPAALHDALWKMCLTLFAALVIAALGFAGWLLGQDLADGGTQITVAGILVVVWIGVLPFLVVVLVMLRLLPTAARSLTLTFARRSGWSDGLPSEAVGFELAGVAVCAAAVVLLLSMGGAIFAAPVIVPSLVVLARSHRTRAYRAVTGVLVGLIAAEVVWAATYLTIEESQPWIWLLPLTAGLAAGAALVASTAPSVSWGRRAVAAPAGRAPRGL